ATYGVIRSSVLRGVPAQRDFTGSDRAFLCDIAMRGRFVQLDDELFFKRYHEGNIYVDLRERMSWFKPQRRAGRPEFPNWLIIASYWRVAISAPLPAAERVRCLGWCVVRTVGRTKNMMRDVQVALLAL